ncbi:hypothetical protein WJX74_006268 [Apatococcus lobatus]|uniref:Uncharacterized protein n=1 Tax=Apatococcus lobatus TaxID=904363 RepID=A0AAW1R2W5_9CHLO
MLSWHRRFKIPFVDRAILRSPKTSHLNLSYNVLTKPLQDVERQLKEKHLCVTARPSAGLPLQAHKARPVHFRSVDQSFSGGGIQDLAPEAV